MSKFRFTAKRIFELMQTLKVFPGEKDSCDVLTEALNKDLEAEEANVELVEKPQSMTWSVDGGACLNREEPK